MCRTGVTSGDLRAHGLGGKSGAPSMRRRSIISFCYRMSSGPRLPTPHGGKLRGILPRSHGHRFDSNCFYHFDEGQRESIRRIISAAKSILSRNAISRAGDGLPSSADIFRHAKIVAMTPMVRLRPSSISFSILGSPQGFAAKEGNYSLLLLLPLIPSAIGRRRVPEVYCCYSASTRRCQASRNANTFRSEERVLAIRNSSHESDTFRKSRIA